MKDLIRKRDKVRVGVMRVGKKKTDKGRHVQQLIYQGIKPAPTSQEFYISSRRNWVGVWFNICGHLTKQFRNLPFIVKTAATQS